jgi:large subunit ribosomal protein L18
MKPAKNLNKKRAQRIGRVRAKVSGTAERPRLVVNRTNRYIYAQIIDDTKGHTLFSASSLGAKKGAKSEQALAIGEALGKKAAEKGIKQVVFDRRSYQFHGRVKNFAEGVIKAGITI